MEMLGALALVIGAALAGVGIWLISERPRIIQKGKREAHELVQAAQRKVAEAEAKSMMIVDNGKKEASTITADAMKRIAASDEKLQSRISATEITVAQLRDSEKEITARLKASTISLLKQSDLYNTKASILDYISDEELLDSAAFQEERNEIRAEMKRLAKDAITSPNKIRVDAEIVRFATISAKADIVGALLVTTAEMLADRVSASNGQNTISNMDDTISVAESLLRLTDSSASITRQFADILRKRITSQWQYRRAKELQREVQREAKDQEREERKARQEAERAQLEAEREEEITERAIAQAEARLAKANEAEREKFEIRLKELKEELEVAKKKMERARSRAQETRQGNVYIISNIGSFGEGIFKIGMTRRLDPMDRIWELSDASVPFDFDVHALIECDDAPTLESELHRAFRDHRINQINLRKEFFKVSIDDIRNHLKKSGHSPTIRLIPSADEFYASIKRREMAPSQSISS